MVIFLMPEDEFGHIPCVVWPQVYRRYRLLIKEPVLLARGSVTIGIYRNLRNLRNLRIGTLALQP